MDHDANNKRMGQIDLGDTSWMAEAFQDPPGFGGEPPDQVPPVLVGHNRNRPFSANRKNGHIASRNATAVKLR